LLVGSMVGYTFKVYPTIEPANNLLSPEMFSMW